MADSKNIRVVLKGVRGSFLHVIKPQERTNDDKKLTGYVFNGSFLVPKMIDDQTNPLAVEINAAMKKAIEARWPGQGKKIPAADKCFIDGEPKDEDTGDREPLYDGYEGMYVLRANQGVSIEEWEDDRKNPVQLLGPKKDKDGKFPRLKGAEAEKLFYSGAYFDVIVNIYAYDGAKKGHKSRVSASLEVIQFKRHGEAFGAAPVDAEQYLDEGDDEDMDDGLGGDAAADDDIDLLAD